MFSSKRRRKKWIESLNADGVDHVTAQVMAWAAFPFDDSQRPRDRDFVRTVRSESRDYLRSAKGAGYGEALRLASGTLERWSYLATDANERYYSALYGSIVRGVVPEGV